MSKHTPGPWHVSEEWDGTSIKAGQFHVTHTIQSCGFHSDEEDKAVTQANARLIAAAPDLMGAVLFFMDMVGEPPQSNCSCHIAPPCDDCVEHAGLREAFDVARAAIAKATGGQA